VRVRINGRWYDLAKTGRRACDNLMLERVVGQSQSPVA
jgi:hypothetical protein